MKDDVCEVLGLCPAGSKLVVAHCLCYRLGYRHGSLRKQLGVAQYLENYLTVCAHIHSPLW